MSDITPAPWTIGDWGEILVGDPRLLDRLPMSGVSLTMASPPMEVRQQAEANKDLLFEAGKVKHETGLTPRQILRQRDKLLEALEELLEMGRYARFDNGVTDSTGTINEGEHWYSMAADKARAILAKLEAE